VVRLGTCAVAVDGTVGGTGRREPAACARSWSPPKVPAAVELLGLPPVARAVTAVYFAADAPPVPDKLVMLDGDRSGPAGTVAVISNVAPTYAPPGRALVVAEVLGPVERDGVEDAVRAQLRGWFGAGVGPGGPPADSYRILHAHPDQRPGFSARQRVLGGGRFGGDHRETAIQGAPAWGSAPAARRVLGEPRRELTQPSAPASRIILPASSPLGPLPGPHLGERRCESGMSMTERG
jgi:hypothetical protein